MANNSLTFTPAQDAAIHHGGHNVLVSASAGSGKTRVLVERVIDLVLNEENETDVTNLLVVTFTNAAAKEMRDRVQTTLRQRINALAGDDEATGHIRRDLLRQLNLLGSADISTLDAFCLRLVQKYYYVIHLDPVFRQLADPTEAQLLKETVWGDLRERLYADDTDDQFATLTRNFSNDRDDQGLQDLVFRLATFATAKANPTAWLASLADVYQLPDGDLWHSDLVQQNVRPDIEDTLRQCLVDVQTAQALAEGFSDDGYLTKWTKLLAPLQAVFADLVNQLTTCDWNTLRTAIADVDLGRSPSLRKLESDDQRIHDQLKNVRAILKKRLDGLVDRYLSLSEDDVLTVNAHAQMLVSQLADVVQQFMDAFASAKRQRHLVDFGDLEHFALTILRDESVQVEVAAKYHEVLVDEYQDINELQEQILQAVAHKAPQAGNMFMVGDMKQSIYRFRLADPTLFLHKYNTFSNDAAGTGIDDERIILADNFRSMKNVDAFTNLVFSQLMDERLGEMNYAGDAELQYGPKDYPNDDIPKTQVMIYQSGMDDTTSNDTELEDVDDALAINDRAEGQIVMVAAKIKEMVANREQIFNRRAGEYRDITYADIALLVPTRNNNLLLQEQFAKLGVPLEVRDTANYFQTTEIQIMMALLRIIDNPYQDIPLVAVLRSPIVGLTENELAYLRIQNKTSDYFQALLDFEERIASNDAQIGAFGQEIHVKIQQFLQQLWQFKNIARQNQLVTLIWTIYQETGFLDYVAGMPGGQQRASNLHALYARAADYENSSFKGVFQFVRFITEMQKRDKDLAEVTTATNADAVSVMTIHGSKGLEFPVVFVMDASHGFNMADQRSAVVVDDHFGIGITWYDEERHLKVDTLQKKLVASQSSRKLLAEEMRVLYVALTRAQQRLFIVGTYKDEADLLKHWDKAANNGSLTLSTTLRAESKNFMDWIGMALLRTPKVAEQLGVTDLVTPLPVDKKAAAERLDSFELTLVSKEELQSAGMLTVVDETATAYVDELQQAAKAAQFGDLNVDELEQILSFSYANKAATQTTAYQSVSELKRMFEEPDQNQLGTLSLDETSKAQSRIGVTELRVPQFMQTVSAPTAAEIGTATHLVLQEIDLSTGVPTAESIQMLINQLVNDHVLTDAVALKINVDQVLAFYDSELGQNVVTHREGLHREAAFSLLMPAYQLYQGINRPTDLATAEQILVHGIIDGYFVDNGALTVFDYKTDHLNATDMSAGLEKLANRYKGQLNLYAAALTSMTGLPVEHKLIYSLSAGKAIEIK
ncbi:helicase-exonuclease AddAB subunit AddA [Furfurilactobacillus siliginis]|uniref:ATP-dependent helicase/nuclease subunit A n=1 Tax=Furfurilactobacillus siliginis TaxID=348151 RepID=A0A0R2KWX1_9LACO|nr:helicase-exonuclease AddAB subunit AddA [Furfurilactobacillus siliginis]KRN93986.1 ATP-dependent exoDNAse (exonuclease V) beta subunit [Furfurilactobacillus siliginis]GEK29222.1 ATP-dependent helicase/nuclease subunit A [Furfurilactobacillus siliginis]